MKLTQLRTYWDTDDAYTVIAFLDELRDVLWTVYGDEIIEHQQALHQEDNDQKDQSDEIPFDDDLNLF
jgi:hypothetical protein